MFSWSFTKMSCFRLDVKFQDKKDLLFRDWNEEKEIFLLTCFAVVSSISRYTITAIASIKINTGSSVLAWTVRTHISYIYK